MVLILSSFLDECDQFAMTIGRVMEEASEKVDGNIGELKTDYARKLQKLEDIIKKVTKSAFIRCIESVQ